MIESVRKGDKLVDSISKSTHHNKSDPEIKAYTFPEFVLNHMVLNDTTDRCIPKLGVLRT